MQNYLDEIITRKKSEVENYLKTADMEFLNQIKIHPKNRFSMAISGSHLAIIAEIKRKSPSLGEIAAIVDPTELALKYCEGGASAISVLTDTVGFGGTIEDLKTVSETLSQRHLAVVTLRKDFIVHPIQIAEAAYAGAACVLLIANVLGEQLNKYIEAANQYGLDALVEIHNEEELKISLDAGAEIIGINHRNLQTFTIDLKLSDQLRPMIPSNIITVAESGMRSREHAIMMRNLGYDAILVGESLVKSSDPSKLILEMRAVS